MLAVTSVLVLSASQAMEVDPDLPQPLDLEFANQLVKQSPFTRTVSFEDTYQLTGVAYVDGKPVATVLNKQTKQRFVVTEEPNTQGWALLSATPDDELEHTQVEMSVAGELVAMHYEVLQPGNGTGGAAPNAKSGKDGGKPHPYQLLGQDGKRLYASLSREGRDKFKDLVKASQEKHPEFTPEQKSAYAQKVFTKLKATDKGGNTASRGKPSKRKQGGA